MPNIKSAKKRVKVSERQKEENITVRGSMKTSVKKALNDAKDKALVQDAFKKIDKAAKAGIIKKNTAARKKSNIMKKVNEK